MDAAVNPPVRIQAIKSTEASAKTVQRSIDSFLVDFQSRCTPAKGGNTTITAQLQKLSQALHEERGRKRNTGASAAVCKFLLVEQSFTTLTDEPQ
jgi:L-2-hydroxyglutarate oxidase LhgO